MKPWVELGRAKIPGGGEMILVQRDEEFLIEVGRLELMTSRAHDSEEELARLCCAHLGGRPGAQVLIGGLGMGYTLRSALDMLPSDARVLVAELVPEVVAWNRGPLAALAGNPLDDPRVTVEIGDVAAIVRRSAAAFDAIALDMDSGPGDLILQRNRGIHETHGLKALHRALRQPGTIAIWSVSRRPRALPVLQQAGFRAAEHRVAARERRGGTRRGRARFIYVGQR